MKILLIGKYPPLQGGISAKTYWLCKGLIANGFEYKIVTINEAEYSNKDNTKTIEDVIVLKKNDVPWHIPETSLIDDQITHAALKAAKTFGPDLIETNYLWPFCKDALLVSKIIKEPFLIRHAGSDILKFYKNERFRDIIDIYFNQATAVVTNESSKTIVTSICSNPEKVHCIQRYVPCPETFKSFVQQGVSSPDKTFDILFAGKINYHWRHKGLELLLKIIKTKNLSALFIIGGKYKNDLEKLIADNNIEENIKIINFVHPEKMPEIYHSCRFVWCWEEEGGVNDFSNIIWEALFCNTPCILNLVNAEKIRLEGIPSDFDFLLYELNEITIFEFDFKHTNNKINLHIHKEKLYKEYIDRNAALYKNLIKKT